MHLYAVVYSAYTLSNQFKLVIENINTYFVEQYTKYQEEREREKTWGHWNSLHLLPVSTTK